MATKLQLSKNARLVDDLGATLEKIAELQMHADDIKSQLKNRVEGRVDGIRFYAQVTESTRKSFSTVKAKKFLTPLQIKKCSTETETTTVRVYRDGGEV